MQNDKLFPTKHKCLVCRGCGKVEISEDGRLALPVDCQHCDASGRVDKETFMKQAKYPLLNISNLEIMELYESGED